MRLQPSGHQAISQVGDRRDAELELVQIKLDTACNTSVQKGAELVVVIFSGNGNIVPLANNQDVVCHNINSV